MGDSGREAAAAEAGAAAEAPLAGAWAAAGMAQARAAAAHQCATLDACLHAWTAKANAGDAMRAAAGANGRVVGGGGGRISRRAIAETAAAMHRAVDALDGSAAEFGQAARLSEASAEWWARAAGALGRGGMASRERAARERAEESRRMAETLDEWAGGSAETARMFRDAAAGWVANTAEWDDGCRMDGGGRAEWMASRDAMREAADGELARAEEMGRHTARAARIAAGELAHVAADSDRRAAAARGELEGPDAQEAAAALRDAVAAAERAATGR